MDNEELEALLELREFQTQEKSQGFLADDVLICECNCLSVGEIKEALLTGKINHVDLNFLQDCLGLGSGCSSCLKSFDSWKGKVL